MDNMTKLEKEARCYQLLVARDKINQELREIQDSLKEDSNG